MRRFVYYNAASVGATLLLDLYPAAAAYSLRKLRTAYTGACIRVRRSSDNTEQDIGFSAGVLDTAALLSFVGAGNGFVVTWYDQSGNGWNKTQTTAGSQPQVVSSGNILLVASKPTVRFNGSSQYFFINSAIPVGALNSEFSFFSVYKTASLALTQVLFRKRNTSTFPPIYGPAILNKNQVFVTRNNANTLIVSQTATNPIVSTVDNNLLTWINENTPLNMYHDSGLEFTGNHVHANTTITTNVCTVGVDYQSGPLGSYLNGNLSELVIYNTNESANRTAIESNINSYYAIY